MRQFPELAALGSAAVTIVAGDRRSSSCLIRSWLHNGHRPHEQASERDAQARTQLLPAKLARSRSQ
jgi:hypothetical protein